MNAKQQVEQEFECKHISTEIRYWDNVSGTRLYQRQCLNCGCKVGDFIRHTDIESPALIKPFDDRLIESYNCLKRDRLNDLQPTKHTDFWQEYNAYLLTPEWQHRRAQVLKRDHHTCQACLNATATQAHHKTYDHIYNEPLFDLVAVCEDCHRALTAMDRSRRNVYN